MRNSLLTKESCAKDITGLSLVPKIRMSVNLLADVVGERSPSSEVKPGGLVEDGEVMMLV